jgi:hypothetical protein
VESAEPLGLTIKYSNPTGVMDLKRLQGLWESFRAEHLLCHHGQRAKVELVVASLARLRRQGAVESQRVRSPVLRAAQSVYLAISSCEVFIYTETSHGAVIENYPGVWVARSFSCSTFNGGPAFRMERAGNLASPVTASLHTDASMKGWGGVVSAGCGFFGANLALSHLLELKAVRFQSGSFLENCAGGVIGAATRRSCGYSPTSQASQRNCELKALAIIGHGDISLEFVTFVRYIRFPDLAPQTRRLDASQRHFPVLEAAVRLTGVGAHTIWLASSGSSSPRLGGVDMAAISLGTRGTNCSLSA